MREMVNLVVDLLLDKCLLLRRWYIYLPLSASINLTTDFLGKLSILYFLFPPYIPTYLPT